MMSTTTAKSITSRKTISESFKVSIVRELSSLELFLETEPKFKRRFLHETPHKGISRHSLEWWQRLEYKK